MTGLWLASYLVLWGIVLVVCVLLVGVLRQLGLLYRRLEPGSPSSQESGSIPALEYDGPTIGSPLVDLDAQSINGFGNLLWTTLDKGEARLFVFMSPMCEACQHIVEPLNALVAHTNRAVRSVVIMRADEQACRAFLSVFPLHMPVVCDRDRAITMELNVHRTPFGLLYNDHGILIRKALLEGQEDLLALLGDGAAPVRAQANVFPPLASSQAQRPRSA
ncbi:MAG TPA: hypothetical protein VKR83_17295 [Ktedonobacteraceae bacterium]|nr:hypothetical protein [Ktedonobacteraceae bacterium]